MNFGLIRITVARQVLVRIWSCRITSQVSQLLIQSSTSFRLYISFLDILGQKASNSPAMCLADLRTNLAASISSGFEASFCRSAMM